ncbi:MAG: DUF1349 domain-containing protein [Chloroflexi bacterium CFX4]|nr:DUF1349 domain-containing protein [Chloroflexi bacterium CFX4]MDL1921808.1 DUF1349 domain-containing protein [Chloroflexi bacterium CFX3]
MIKCSDGYSAHSAHKAALMRYNCNKPLRCTQHLEKGMFPMTSQDFVTIATLPHPLRWHGNPQQWAFSTDHTLSIRAAGRTDWFIDPETGTASNNAPALLMPVKAPCLLSALVEAEHAATFDAGVLFIHQTPQLWAKLCLERSPQGEVMIVSVVTNGLSDDCNAMVVPDGRIYLRIAKLERTYAFHYSHDGNRWLLIRHFRLGDSPEAEIGFLAQSPMGEGCTAHFRHITYRQEKLADIRSQV